MSEWISVNATNIELIEERHDFTSDQKLQALGYGEWVEEPDYISFKYKDFKCEVKRTLVEEPYCPGFYGGHLCGYVIIPIGNVFYEINYMESDIDCHGGLTYGRFSEDDPNEYKIGFDCAHSGDYVPSIERMRKNSDFRHTFSLPEEFKKFAIFNPTYRNIEFCIHELKSIVEQVIEKGKRKNHER